MNAFAARRASQRWEMSVSVGSNTTAVFGGHWCASRGGPDHTVSAARDIAPGGRTPAGVSERPEMDGAAPRNPPIPREARGGGGGGGGGGARRRDRPEGRAGAPGGRVARRRGRRVPRRDVECAGKPRRGRRMRGCRNRRELASGDPATSASTAGVGKRSRRRGIFPRGRPIFWRRRRRRREGGRCDVYQNATNHHSEPPSASLMRCHETRGGASADFGTSPKDTCGSGRRPGSARVVWKVHLGFGHHRSVNFSESATPPPARPGSLGVADAVS